MKKAVKRSRRDEAKRQKKAADKAASISTSSAPSRGPTPDPNHVDIPPILEGEIVIPLTTIGVNVVVGEAKEASPYLTDASSK